MIIIVLAKSYYKKSPPVQKSNMKLIWGIMKDKVVETNDCWKKDLEKTI
jgi:hypothetical protein